MKNELFESLVQGFKDSIRLAIRLVMAPLLTVAAFVNHPDRAGSTDNGKREGSRSRP